MTIERQDLEVVVDDPTDQSKNQRPPTDWHHIAPSLKSTSSTSDEAIAGAGKYAYFNSHPGESPPTITTAMAQAKMSSNERLISRTIERLNKCAVSSSSSSSSLLLCAGRQKFILVDGSKFMPVADCCLLLNDDSISNNRQHSSLLSSSTSWLYQTSQPIKLKTIKYHQNNLNGHDGDNSPEQEQLISIRKRRRELANEFPPSVNNDNNSKCSDAASSHQAITAEMMIMSQSNELKVGLKYNHDDSANESSSASFRLLTEERQSRKRSKRIVTIGRRKAKEEEQQQQTSEIVRNKSPPSPTPPTSTSTLTKSFRSHHCCQKQQSLTSLFIFIVYLLAICIIMHGGSFFFESHLSRSSFGPHLPQILMANALDYWPKFGTQSSNQIRLQLHQRQNNKILSIRSIDSATTNQPYQQQQQHPIKLQDGLFKNYFIPTTPKKTTTTTNLVDDQLGNLTTASGQQYNMTSKTKDSNDSSPSTIKPQSSLYHYYQTVMDRYKQAMGATGQALNSVNGINGTNTGSSSKQNQKVYNSNLQQLSYRNMVDQYPKFTSVSQPTASTHPQQSFGHQLGSQCRYSRDCRNYIENSHCDGDNLTCTCLPYHVPLNSTVCLPPALLSYSCRIDSQCLKKVPNSQCLDGLCQCQPEFVAHRKDKCLPPATVNDYCLKDDQCRLNDKYSYCKWIIPHIYGKCKCPINNLVSGSHCWPRLGDECKLDSHCQMATDNSYCQPPSIRALRGQLMVARCTCRPEYEMSNNRMSCNLKSTPTTTTIISTTTTGRTAAPGNDDYMSSTPPQTKIESDSERTRADLDHQSLTNSLPPSSQMPTTMATMMAEINMTSRPNDNEAQTTGFTAAARESSSSTQSLVTTIQPVVVMTTGATTNAGDSDSIMVMAPKDQDNLPLIGDSYYGQQMDKAERDKNKYEVIIAAPVSPGSSSPSGFDGATEIQGSHSANISIPVTDTNEHVMNREEIAPAVTFTLTSTSTTTTTASSIATSPDTSLSSRAPEIVTLATSLATIDRSATTTAVTSTSTTSTTTTTATPTTTEFQGVGTRYRAVSLGKKCWHKKECQLRDPYSDCIDGVCECQRPTSQCGAKATGCSKDTFQCRNGQCISWYFVCDKFKNCDDGSDEEECVPGQCPKEAFQCDDGTCITRSKVCNGHWECPDGSDEARCYKGISCDPKAFRCQNGQCLPQYVFCNAVEDCLDGSDEIEQTCENNSMAQVSTTVVSATSRQRKYHKKFQLGRSQLGRAQPSTDSMLMMMTDNNLYDGANNANLTSSESSKCPKSSFTCNNGKCRSTAILCSGVDGCGDGSDEDRCEVCSCQPPEGLISSLVDGGHKSRTYVSSRSRLQ